MILRISSLPCLLAFALVLTACVAQEQPSSRSYPIQRPTFISMVVSVTDGDTLSAVVNGVPEKIRLTGIDCPEDRQPFGSEATQMTKQLALEKAVRVTEVGRDKFHRLLGEVVLPDGRMLNQELVRAGVCWWYRKYAPGDTVLEGLEKYAREERKGLWTDPYPVPPWEWRTKKMITCELGLTGSDANHCRDRGIIGSCPAASCSMTMSLSLQTPVPVLDRRPLQGNAVQRKRWVRDGRLQHIDEGIVRWARFFDGIRYALRRIASLLDVLREQRTGTALHNRAFGKRSRHSYGEVDLIVPFQHLRSEVISNQYRRWEQPLTNTETVSIRSVSFSRTICTFQ